MQNGGTLTHHHAVGYEHRPWMEREVTRPGITLLRGLKSTLDPGNIMNPGKLIPPDGSEEKRAESKTPSTTVPYEK